MPGFPIPFALLRSVALSPILGLFLQTGGVFLAYLPSQAFPFDTTPESFQTYVNQMWKSGGSGLAYFNFDTSDPAHTGRRYFNFHNCKYSQPHDRSPGALWETISCSGYVNHESPIRNFTCKIQATYHAFNTQDYIAANKRLQVGETGDFKMCDE